ncbi:MAG: iron-only hydrogenase system regulator [Clostridia bacterium]|nr:iron-only hydrogenase system regulator [Clostridia bacterium]
MNRVALIGIMIEDNKASAEINAILHEYSEYVVGRMGLPNVRDNMNVISVVIDAPADVVNAMSGKLGRIDGVTSKSICSKSEEA